MEQLVNTANELIAVIVNYVSKLLKLDPTNTELLTQKQKLLKDAIGSTKEKLDALKLAQEQAKSLLESGDLGQDKYDALQREIIETEQELKRLQEQAIESNAALAKIEEVGDKLQTAGDKIYIPENVYIIGTMNDIDRSVDSFDFAMRRRFRFVELKADERLEMLASLEDEELEAEAIRRMAALNREIASVADLNENYQIGASYFLKLKTLNFDQLWTDYLQPLLHEYVQGKYRNQLRRMNDPEREKELKEQAKAISAELKPLREDLRMAKRIEEKYPQLQQLLETERDMETRVRTRERERGYER